MSKADPTTHHASRMMHDVAISLSCAALVVVFWSLLQLDLPLARFVRSLHLPWLELAGDVGSRVGSGAILVAISGSLLAIGLALKRSAFRRAGVESLIAHGAAALCVQALKHLIGRPRPRLTHGDAGFQFGPSWDSGLDSFPSGHAAASFAVVAVLATRFPKARWFLYGAATAVALSRVLRGSHFPTDVVAGVALGLLAGSVVANPISEWRASLRAALMGLAPPLVMVFALLWAVLRPAPDGWLNAIMVAVGTVGVAFGVGSRLYRAGKGRGDSGLSGSSQTQLLASRLLIVIGLALTTGSWLVTGVAALVVLAQWLTHQNDERRMQNAERQDLQHASFRIKHSAVWEEVALAIGLALAVVAINGMRGMLPLP